MTQHAGQFEIDGLRADDREAWEAMTFPAYRHLLSLRRHGGDVTLELRDDGKGFDLDEAMRRGRLGLLGMRERAEMLGGKLRVESTPRDGGGVGGTTILATLPCEEAESAGRALWGACVKRWVTRRWKELFMNKNSLSEWASRLE